MPINLRTGTDMYPGNDSPWSASVWSEIPHLILTATFMTWVPILEMGWGSYLKIVQISKWQHQNLNLDLL